MKKNGIKGKESASFSALLASETLKASRAARIERATRWGARVLWGGAFLVGASAWQFEQNSPIVERNIAIVLASAICVGFWGALKEKSSAPGRRALALSGARRLESRFPAQLGVFVAAVDFCEEERRGLSQETETTSEGLRDATVAEATRRYAEIASQLDDAELLAVLAERPVELFQKIRQKRRFLVLGLLANMAIWVSLVSWDKWSGKDRPILEPKSVSASHEIEKKGRNEENEGNNENGVVEENVKNKEREGLRESEEGTAREEASLATLELLISELAQNAKIAESLKTELEQAAVEENRTSERNGTPSDATRYLQLARELKANLERPATGLVAQTRRLSAATRRERRKIEARLEEIKDAGKNDGIGETSETDGGPAWNSRRISGKEVAVFWAAARLAELETILTSANGVGDWAPLELSRVLRSDLAAERKKILAEASARVGRWEATLRREEAATRILCESWRFDAMSQRWLELVNWAEQENQALLTRFAGRLSVDFNASDENGEELEEAKQQFNAIWSETQVAETECVAIVERLRGVLQSVAAKDFIDFVRKNEGALKGLDLWNEKTDEAFGLALDDTTSRIKDDWTAIAKNVENNCFGRAAERLENVVELLGKGIAPIRNENWQEEKKEGNLGIKEGAETEIGRTTDEIGNDDWREGRRFSALTAALTLGVDEKTAREIGTQAPEKERIARLIKAKNDALIKRNATTNDEKEGKKTSTSEGEKEENLSRILANGERRRLTDEEDESTKSEVNADKIANLSAAWDDGFGNGINATGEELQSENGATAVGVSEGNGAKKEEREKIETADNKAFSAELPSEARRRFEGTEAPQIAPEYAEKARLYRRRISEKSR